MNYLGVNSHKSNESNDLTHLKCSKFPSWLSYLRMTEEAKYDHGECRSKDDSENNGGERCVHSGNDEVLHRDKNRTRPAVQRGPELKWLSRSVGGWVWRRNHCRWGHGVNNRRWHGVCVMQTSWLRVICVRAELLRRRPLQCPVTRQTHPESQRDRAQRSVAMEFWRFKNIFSNFFFVSASSLTWCIIYHFHYFAQNSHDQKGAAWLKT